MALDRRSPVVLGTAVGCVAGLVAFLAFGQEDAVNFAAAPVVTARQVTLAPSALATAASTVPTVAPAVEEAFEQAPVEEYAVSAPVQAKSWGAILSGLMMVPLAAAGLMMSRNKSNKEERQLLVNIDDLVNVGKQAVVASAVVGASASMADMASAYPIFAQQGYATPREATGRIVCANCHLAAKKTELELPQAVLPDQVFEAVSKVPYSGAGISSPVDASSVVGSVTFKDGQPVEFMQEAGIPVSQALIDIDGVPGSANTVFKATIKVPYDESLKQVNAKGKPADLNVGAVLVLPEGFRLAPPERIPEKMKEEINGLQFIQYSEDKPNILVVGPVPGKMYAEMHVALLSPDPAVDKKAEFGSLPVYVGGNRGRGQLYPSGEKSNNNAYVAEHSGKIADIELNEKKRIYTLAIEETNGLITNEVLPPGAELLVKKGDVIEAGQAITTNPNVGGFGQAEGEIVLQDPGRIKALLFFSFTVLATQTMLVVKKKQYEQVQLSEMNF